MRSVPKMQMQFILSVNVCFCLVARVLLDTNISDIISLICDHKVDHGHCGYTLFLIMIWL